MAKIENKEAMKIMTGKGRVSYPHLFKPSATKPGRDPMYSVEMLFDQTTTKRSDFDKPLIAAATAKWGADKSLWPSPLKLPIRDGNKPFGKDKDGKKSTVVKEEHKGMWVVRANSNAKYQRPWVVGKNPKVHLTSEAEMYPGCYARVALYAHAYGEGEVEGVKFVLEGIQFIEDGESLGGKKAADEMFGVIEDDSLPVGAASFGDEENQDEIPF